jgi:hypothetical protein
VCAPSARQDRHASSVQRGRGSSKAIEHDSNYPLNRLFRGHRARCFKTAQAKYGQVLWRYIGADKSSLTSLGQQSLKDLDQVPLWRSDVFTLMDQRSEFSTMLVPLERDQRIGLEDGFESSTWFAGLSSELG